MARAKLFVLMVCAVVVGATGSKAQSKKEIIEMLTQKTDSLQKLLSAKNESLHQLEVKLAKFEGAAEAHNGIIQRLESKYDSVRESLTAKTALVETLTTEKAKLTSDIELLQARDKAWSIQSDSLYAALQSIQGQVTPPAAISRIPVKPAPAQAAGVNSVKRVLTTAQPAAEVAVNASPAPGGSVKVTEKVPAVPSPAAEAAKASQGDVPVPDQPAAPAAKTN